MNLNNIYLVTVILITSIALFILVGFLINYYVIYKNFIKIWETSNTNNDQLLRSLFHYVTKLSCVFFPIVYIVFILQIITLILTRYYYNTLREVRGLQGIRGLRGLRGPKGPPGKCSVN